MTASGTGEGTKDQIHFLISYHAVSQSLSKQLSQILLNRFQSTEQAIYLYCFVLNHQQLHSFAYC